MEIDEKRLKGIWYNMLDRCSPKNKNKERYRCYAGKGIDVCEAWKDYRTFREWAITHGYKDHLTLDRINGDRGYSPSNCRWATRQLQANNPSPATVKKRAESRGLTVPEYLENRKLVKSGQRVKHEGKTPIQRKFDEELQRYIEGKSAELGLQKQIKLNPRQRLLALSAVMNGEPIPGDLVEAVGQTKLNPALKEYFKNW